MHIARNASWAVAVLVVPALFTACSDVERATSSSTSPAGAASTPKQASANAPEAKTDLTTAGGARVGTVTFSSTSGGAEVDVVLTADKAVMPGRFHGIHVHANDDPANGDGCKADPAAAASTWFTAVDGHLKAGNATHVDHTGDFPSLLVRKDGSASLRFTTDRFTPAEVVGKAVIVHAAADNFGNIPVGSLPDQYTPNAEAASTKTAGTGNAGDRVACGMIART